MKTITLLLISFMAMPVTADVTGAGDAAMLQQLFIMVKQVKEQVKEARRVADLTEKLKEHDELKELKKLSEEGKALKSILNESNNIDREIREFIDDPTGTDKQIKQIENLKRDIKAAKDSPNAARAYANIMMELRNLEMLKKAQTASKNKLAGGTTDDEESEITASNTMIMADILISQEQRKKRIDANNTSIIKDVLGGSSYKSMVE